MSQATAKQLGLVIGDTPLTYTMACQLPDMEWSDTLTPIARAMLHNASYVIAETNEGDLERIYWSEEGLFRNSSLQKFFLELVGWKLFQPIPTDAPALSVHWDAYDGREWTSHAVCTDVRVLVGDTLVSLPPGVFRLAKSGEKPVSERIIQTGWAKGGPAVDVDSLPLRYAYAVKSIVDLDKTFRALPLVILDK